LDPWATALSSVTTDWTMHALLRHWPGMQHRLPACELLGLFFDAAPPAFARLKGFSLGPNRDTALRLIAKPTVLLAILALFR